MLNTNKRLGKVIKNNLKKTTSKTGMPKETTLYKKEILSYKIIFVEKRNKLSFHKIERISKEEKKYKMMKERATSAPMDFDTLLEHQVYWKDLANTPKDF